jgi:Excalibur calcium-binding domain
MLEWPLGQRHRRWEDPDDDPLPGRRRRAALWRRHDRALRVRRGIRRAKAPAFVVVCVAGLCAWAGVLDLWRPAVDHVAGTTGASRWPPGVILRHVAARGSCRNARAVGLAPARRGEPGYWPHLDADEDGVACEPYPGPGWR